MVLTAFHNNNSLLLAANDASVDSNIDNKIDNNMKENALSTSTQVPAHHDFPAFDSTYFVSHAFWLLIAFGLFYLFVSKVLVRLIGSALEIRHDRIASDLDNAARIQAQTNEIMAKCEATLQEARIKFRTIVTEAKLQAANEAEENRKQLEERLTEKLKDAAIELDEVKSSMQSTIEEIAAEITPILVEKLSHGQLKK